MHFTKWVPDNTISVGSNTHLKGRQSSEVSCLVTEMKQGLVWLKGPSRMVNGRAGFINSQLVLGLHAALHRGKTQGIKHMQKKAQIRSTKMENGKLRNININKNMQVTGANSESVGVILLNISLLLKNFICWVGH